MKSYHKQEILLASKHAKEQVIAPAFQSHLSCEICVRDFDTDQFGTFTGEIPRTLSAYDTCVLKATQAAACHGYELSLASEGSFGPHPQFPFVPQAHEWMVFIDRPHHWIISEQLVSQKTNYAMLTIDLHTQIDTFLAQVGFPSHALVLQASSDKRVLAKGISTYNDLETYLKMGFQTESSLLLSTDMRAMMNPTRMTMIGELAQKLAQRIATPCPACHAPGFGFQKTVGVLPCGLCGAPTSFYREVVWGCVACEHVTHKAREDGLLEADPTYCQFCNP